MVRDNRWLMVADREQIQRRLYDDDEEADDDIKRYDDVANDEPGVLSDLSETATIVAGGTLPEFGPDGTLRPAVEHGDDDVDDDGIPNDFDPVNNDEVPDDTSREELQFDGRKPVSGERVNPSPEFLYAHKWRIFGVMMVAWAMTLLDVSIVNIAIPDLQDELSTDVATVTWVINAYNIAFAILLVSMGRLADQFGRKRFFLIGLTVFTVGSALCAAAWSVEWLMAFRVIQGVGAGILAPLGFAITVLVFPPEQRGSGLALIAVVALVSSAFGPVLGGVLVEVASWHWIFLINIPFGILGAGALAWRWWPETWDLSAGREVDVRGMLLLAGAVLCLTVALIEANPFGGDLALWLSLMQASILLRGGLRLVGAPCAQPDDRSEPARQQAVPQREHRHAVLRRRRDRQPAAALAGVHQPLGLRADRGGPRARCRCR